MPEENQNGVTPPVVAQPPQSPKKKGLFAYTLLALIAYVFDIFIVPLFLGGFTAGNGLIIGLTSVFEFGVLIIALLTFGLSLAFFQSESLKERIIKSIFGTIFAGLILLLIGLGFCFLIFSGWHN